jgi:hypothetical protein
MTMLSRAGGAALSGVVLGRVAAILALASATLHLALLDASSLGSFAMVGMALACLPCAWHLWRGPTAGVWCMTAGLDVAMLLIHAQMLAGPAMMSMPGHSRRPSELLALGLGVVGAQLVLAAGAGALVVASRHRR